ncbi:MAG TPA: thioredoxin domain-containing protein [Chthoniobacterales bacterium]|nr:thioredoxin domain-containing protein [Chthoniobacterales bacterium]
MPNRLAHEKSPYLLQHAENPVDWLPWGEEAFAKARRENKPIFLSIGYSTCHWCHVMAHESFESAEVAEVMNREFVNIKVDREERPDVDRVYMTFVQATTGGGGWPMSVWLTPELKPFVGGTYFPPEDRWGQPGFAKVLERIAGAWKQDHEKIAEQGTKIVAALEQSVTGTGDPGPPLGGKALDAAYQQIARSYDAHEGGFSVAPKFPRPVTLNFLTRIHARNPGTDSGKHALEMALFTLRKMAAGGMHDLLGGGFHRYSVDAYWHVPHFEKMLYDQAQLAVAYLDAFQISREPLFEKVARDIFEYVRRDMTAKSGGFFSAEDADSEIGAPVPDRREGGGEKDDGQEPPRQKKKAEGAFYVWSKDEVDKALGEGAEVFNFHYAVKPEGNVPAGGDPHGEFTGKNILIELGSRAATAKHFGKDEAAVRQLLAKSRATLFELRAKRPRPHLDDKIITAWNGLMISAFARGAQVLGDSAYLEAGKRAAKFLRAELYDDSRKTLFRNYREGRSAVEGFADDYAFLIQGLLDLYEASFDVAWLRWAIELQEIQDRLFFDEARGGYFGAAGNDPSILLRLKEDNDSAEPAASSVAALNLFRLAQIRNEARWFEQAEKTIDAFAPQIGHFASAMPQMLVALNLSLSKPRQIVIAGHPASAETRALIAEVHRHFVPNKVLLLAEGGDGQRYLEEKLEAVRGMKPVGGKAAAYVCENFTCKAPVTDPKALGEML